LSGGVKNYSAARGRGTPFLRAKKRQLLQKKSFDKGERIPIIINGKNVIEARGNNKNALV